MENQTITQKLEALVKLQSIDTKLDQLRKLRGDLPDEVQDLEDEIEGYKTRMTRFETDLKEVEDGIKKNKENIKESEKLVKKYNEQQKNVKNNREFDAITKEIELQELEVQICEKRIKEAKEKIEEKKAEISKLDALMKERSDDLENKKKELEEIANESQEEEKKLLTEREKAAKKIEDKFLKYYERLRINLSNGLAVVRVVRGAAEGCNIIIPPQKIAEIREKKKIVIDEHSGRILADVDMESMEEEVKPKKQHPPDEPKKLANRRVKYSLKKAVASVCFFLFISTQSIAVDNVWQFDPALEHVYKLVLELQTDKAYAELARLKTTNEYHRIYVQSFLETVDILITEDEGRFEKVNEVFKQRLEKISQLPDSPEKLFLKAELSIQRGFNLLNLGQELSAVLAIRQAYQATQECIKKYPSFIPIKKTYGVIQVMVGSVPEKYQWFMSLLGMRGSVKVGQKNLDELRLSKSSLSQEATILFYTIKGFINQQFGEAAKGFNESLQKDPDNRLLLYLGMNMLMKDSQSEEALKLMDALDKQPQGISIVYVEYLRGEALLHRGDYTASIHAFQKFLKGYKSQSYRKDSYYKIALCYYLMGNMENAEKNFEIAKETGKTTADPDKYAAAMLEEKKFPNAKILKARFYTDGGYYKEAREMLKSITPGDLPNEKDATEFYYRKGRLAHKTQEIPAAKLFYQQTIDMTGSNPWYFAPNAALQMGYIHQAQGDNVAAKKYYEKALSYKRYEYKNSIDTKAKSALEQLSK